MPRKIIDKPRIPIAEQIHFRVSCNRRSIDPICRLPYESVSSRDAEVSAIIYRLIIISRSQLRAP